MRDLERGRGESSEGGLEVPWCGYARGVRAVIMEAFEWITRKVGDRWAWELDRGW